MAELSNLESKLGEVVGLAMASQAATRKVATLARKEQRSGLAALLQKMQAEAKEAEQRGREVAGTIDGKKSAILAEARQVKQKGTQMMDTYLDEESDALDGLEFLTMAEAGEAGHWEILAHLNKRARHPGVKQLTSWGMPIQKRHLTDIRASSLQLADNEDPNEAA
ncbi:MAG TPA: hypothetical protein VGC78_01000 [Gaiellaceae bacterium]|jgi:hypothetical protein